MKVWVRNEGGQMILVAAREVLLGDRTYYVRTDGADTNDGRSNTAAGAFRTIQKAIDVASALDLSIYKVTIQLAAGTYTAPSTVKTYIGNGPIIILGDETTPSNVLISLTGSPANCFNANGVQSWWDFRGMKLTTASLAGGACFNMVNSNWRFQNLDFGATSGNGFHIIHRGLGSAETTASYSISGSAGGHLFMQQGAAFLYKGGSTVTLTGTPAWATAFVSLDQTAIAQIRGVTWSGSATGTRYLISGNSVVDTAGAGTSHLPGNAITAPTTGGQYV